MPLRLTHSRAADNADGARRLTPAVRFRCPFLRRTLGRAAAAGVAVLLLVAPLVGPRARQASPRIGSVGLPGIDLGLDPQALVDAIGGRPRRLPEGRRAGLTRLPGRVLVKFRESTRTPAPLSRSAVRNGARLTTPRRGAISRCSPSIARSTPKPPPPCSPRRADVEYAQADYFAYPASIDRTIRSTRSMESAGDAARTGLGHQPRREHGDHRRGARHRRGLR